MLYSIEAGYRSEPCQIWNELINNAFDFLKFFYNTNIKATKNNFINQLEVVIVKIVNIEYFHLIK